MVWVSTPLSFLSPGQGNSLDCQRTKENRDGGQQEEDHLYIDTVVGQPAKA